MFTIEGISQERIDVIEKLIPEAKQRLEALSVLDEAEKRSVVMSISNTELDVAIAMASLLENMPLNEFIVKHVDAKSNVTRTKDLKTRQRNAFQTTGLSKAKRRSIARKASKTKRANPSGQKIAQRKQKIAMRKRKALGI
ncbi:head scaffolding protein [Pseudomonas phage PspYZU05]|uniref:Putative prohead core n=1 Tax=Pseudomonas phage PspYZU05 TaxID=1983556 RepID=A0A2U7N2M4_9CAUD|nr:head scaffolding protein [Pseudomonas phage PspYZU05]ASD52085.1 putative prohead core [Pseudomonas phage PspYZU05]